MPGGAEVGAMRLLMGHLLHHGDLLCIPNPVPPIGLISRESGAKASVSDTNTLMTNMDKRMNKAWATIETRSAQDPVYLYVCTYPGSFV
jgi:hypothetical protein